MTRRGRAAAGNATAGLCVSAALGLLALAPQALEAPACSHPSPGAAPGAVTCGVGDAPVLEGPARLLFGLALDPNRAEPAALEALPGIGPARAAAIAAERCRRPFASLPDLERVGGIGPRTRAALEPWLTLDTEAPARCGAVH